MQHWADGGETKLSNLVTLCGFHHRVVHEGGFGITATHDGLFAFTRPDGERVHESGECFRGNITSGALHIRTLNEAAGLAIDSQTSRCRWLGETMDYSHAIEAMQFLRDRAAAASPSAG